jgi:tripartite-type tricarboxylate transporter receptor subunit TctC
MAFLAPATFHTFQDPELKARFDATGTVLVGTSPDEFANIIKTDMDKWALVIKAAETLDQK